MTTQKPDEEIPETQAMARSRQSKLSHDLSGAAITVSGFTIELEIARQHVLALLDRLPETTDAELMQNLRFQVEEEMQQCLLQITKSLENMEATLDTMTSD